MSKASIDAVSLNFGSTTQIKTPNAPVVIGLYGLPGSGKTFMLERLRETIGQKDFAFFDGSKVLDDVVAGGLNQFHQMEEKEKLHWREVAIDSVRAECAKHGQTGIVAGHFMLWAEDAPVGSAIYTPRDLATYTHIIYLSVPAEAVARRCAADKIRDRPAYSYRHLRKWQSAEMTELRSLCRKHGILLSYITPSVTAVHRVATIVQDFRMHSEQSNVASAERLLDDIVVSREGKLQTMLVFDADKTLAAQDSGFLFWGEVSNLGLPLPDQDPLKTLFSSPLGYSYTAFRQATLICEDAAGDQDFDALCENVASNITMYPEFVSLLQKITASEHVGAVIVTCGLRKVWEKVLAREGLSGLVKVIGGGRITDGLVVSGDVKCALVQRLRKFHSLYTLAFGDSPLDLKMLIEADQAIIVVGKESDRSTTMDSSLRVAITDHGLHARQVLMPEDASMRLDRTKLPILELTETSFINSIFCLRQQRRKRLQLVHSTSKKAADLLATPMRDADIAGPALREAHRWTGRYLATEYLPDIIGIEQYPIQHVQRHTTHGFRFKDESLTLIVALMRGGEPMAIGVGDMLAKASFLHAKGPKEIKENHLRGRRVVVLVDSVVNSGKTVVEFAEHIHAISDTIQIIVVAGVIQADFISEGNPLASRLEPINLHLVALRLSENQFQGVGGTDTGNRLFNTTYLP